MAERVKNETGRVMPPHDGYRRVSSSQAARVVYDATVVFRWRFVDPHSGLQA
jgi:hypothetical protein